LRNADRGTTGHRLTRRAFGARLLGALPLAALLSACFPFPSREPLPVITAAPPAPGAAPPEASPAPAAVSSRRPEEVWFSFAEMWTRGEYEAMYALLTPAARDRTGPDRFARYYRELGEMASLQRVIVEVTSSLVREDLAQIGYRSLLVTGSFGTITQDHALTMERHQNDWLVDWHPGLVLSELSDGDSLDLEKTDNLRGAIYDREGSPLAVLGSRVVVGVVPGEIEDEATLLSVLAEVLGDEPQSIKDAYVKALRPDWFMPVGELSSEQVQEHYARLSTLGGVLLRERAVRYYPEGATTSHLTGYVGVISESQLGTMRAEGYVEDDVVGQTGLEQSFEAELAGQRGARLLVRSSSREVRAVVAEKTAVPSQNLYTTIDLDLQRAAMRALEGVRGAVVALDPRNGQVLAVAANPTFDANAMVQGLSGSAWAELLADEGRPLVNRATQSELPPGSVFKVVTESAALDAGVVNPDSTFFCPGSWSGLGESWTVKCWLPSGHGTLTLEEGLVHSCNTVFAEVGSRLDGHDRDALPRWAREYGFGASPGLRGLPASTGLVPDTAWRSRTLGQAWFPGDTVNMAIGQGALLVTPLQVAGMIAAVAAQGRRYRPYLALSFGPPGNPSSTATEPELVGELPLAEYHLSSIRQSLVDGCMSYGGTAYASLGSLPVPVAGKTGTAENPGAAPHAWFAGYAPADDPVIAVAVVVEYGGQGSLVAAPLFRQVIETYLELA